MSGAVLVAIALGAVVLILLAGLYTLFAGGQVAHSWSNILMRFRVLAQLVAVLIIMAVLYFGTG